MLEVIWALRAYRTLRPKLFIRPDQLDDDALRFVELPKLRTGAVRLEWSSTDLYGLFFARIALSPEPEGARAFEQAIGHLGLRSADRQTILTRRWSLASETADQQKTMALLAGRYMGKGTYGYKKGNTYSWPITHLADAQKSGYLPPFAEADAASLRDLFKALERIGVMFRHRDDRLDMPDLFRVAARLLKKGGVAPRGRG
ncbi:MAG: hypothetical protein K9L82_15335 [Chromatiaceae bacterium]|nr:hypothetical protein [Chromatiaceae bacterium]MCF7996329.1 hypothetical protein [Chromatiaceae bacterium]MCF8016846.1 hypothetical protein [Chromatiaceae bacterium]